MSKEFWMVCLEQFLNAKIWNFLGTKFLFLSAAFRILAHNSHFLSAEFPLSAKFWRVWIDPTVNLNTSPLAIEIWSPKTGGLSRQVVSQDRVVSQQVVSQGRFQCMEEKQRHSTLFVTFTCLLPVCLQKLHALRRSTSLNFDSPRQAQDSSGPAATLLPWGNNFRSSL